MLTSLPRATFYRQRIDWRKKDRVVIEAIQSVLAKLNRSGSALNLAPEEGQHLVQYPANGKYTLNCDDVLNDIYPGGLLNRIDYLTKVKSKIFDDGNRSFGCIPVIIEDA